MKIVAAILARAQSPVRPDNLLPERTMAVINGRCVLEWIVDRLKTSKRLTGIVVAVGDDDEDRRIINLARRMGLNVYAGHPDDVLGRLHLVAVAEGADHIVRVNGNFPLVDAEAMDELLDRHLESRADFSLNSHYHGLVYGLGVEVFSRSALERVASRSLNPRQKNLGSLYLHQHPEDFQTRFQPSTRTAPHFRVSIDFKPDLKVVSEILAHTPRPDNDTIIKFLNRRPDLTALQEINVPAEVSLEKVLLFPEKIKALRSNNCVTFDQTYPVSIELSLTNRCNHCCVWCSDLSLRRRLGGEFSTAALFRLFADLTEGGARGIVIEGGGEPTLHPDFNAVVARIKKLGLAAGLITNGFLMPYIGMVDDFEWIRVSLDAASRTQYRQLKGVDGFDRVINNLMSIAAEKRKALLGVGYVLTNRNDDLVQLEQLVKVLRKIGASYIHVRPVVDHPALLSTADIGFLKKYETHDFSVNLAALTDNQEAGNSGLPCLAHSLSTVITADGGVYLCGRLNQFENWQPLGNLHQRTFNEIWNGPERRNQVGLVSQPEFCLDNCPQCRMTKYNRLLYGADQVRTRNFI